MKYHIISGFETRTSRILLAALQNTNIDCLGGAQETVFDKSENQSSGLKSTEYFSHNEEMSESRTGASISINSVSADLWNTPIIILSPLPHIAESNVYSEISTLTPDKTDSSGNYCDSGRLDNIAITRSSDDVHYNHHSPSAFDVEVTMKDNVVDIPNNENTTFLIPNENTSNDSLCAHENSNSDYKVFTTISDTSSEFSNSGRQVKSKTSNKNNNKIVDYSSSESSEDSLNEEKPKRSRSKRHAVKISDWDKNKQKENREKGRAYMGRKNKDGKWQYTVKRNQRVLKPRCDCRLMNKNTKINCRLVSDANRQEIFNNFWKLSWKEKKNV